MWPLDRWGLVTEAEVCSSVTFCLWLQGVVSSALASGIFQSWGQLRRVKSESCLTRSQACSENGATTANVSGFTLSKVLYFLVLAGLAQLFRMLSRNENVAGLRPCQGTYMGYGFTGTYKRQPIDASLITSMFLSPLLSKSNGKMSSDEDKVVFLSFMLSCN